MHGGTKSTRRDPGQLAQAEMKAPQVFQRLEPRNPGYISTRILLRNITASIGKPVQQCSPRRGTNNKGATSKFNRLPQKTSTTRAPTLRLKTLKSQGLTLVPTRVGRSFTCCKFAPWLPNGGPFAIRTNLGISLLPTV